MRKRRERSTSSSYQPSTPENYYRSPTPVLEPLGFHDSDIEILDPKEVEEYQAIKEKAQQQAIKFASNDLRHTLNKNKDTSQTTNSRLEESVKIKFTPTHRTVSTPNKIIITEKKSSNNSITTKREKSPTTDHISALVYQQHQVVNTLLKTIAEPGPESLEKAKILKDFALHLSNSTLDRIQSHELIKSGNVGKRPNNRRLKKSAKRIKSDSE